MANEQEAGASESEDRISLADVSRVAHWANKLGVTPERLREMVARVGPRISDLEEALNRPSSLD